MAQRVGRSWRTGAVGLGLLVLTVPAVALATPGGALAETTDHRTVPLGGATSAEVELNMDFGDLSVRPSVAGGDLLAADFTYDDGDWKPNVDYAVADGKGTLDVQQPGDFGDLDFNDLDNLMQNDGNAWDVALAPAVPMDLTVDLDSGSGQLDLGGLDVRTLDVEMNAGEVTVDLSGGAWAHDLDASIDSEAGSVTLVVPTDVGVRINADVSLGDVNADGFTRDGDAYVNAAYGVSPVTLRVDVHGEVGEVNLKLAS